MTNQLEFNWAEKPPPTAPPPPAPKKITSKISAEELKIRSLLSRIRSPKGSKLVIRFNNNRSTLISLRHKGKELRLSLHQVFLDAPAETQEALSVWVNNPEDKKAGALINAFLAKAKRQSPPKKKRSPILYSRGQVFDLTPHFNAINQCFFDNAITASITWGKHASRRKRRYIRFGSYWPEQNLIRIHPALDQSFVPESVLRHIIHHEMLHAKLGFERSASGRHMVHTKRFYELERAFPDYAEAAAWIAEDKNLKRLLRS